MPARSKHDIEPAPHPATYEFHVEQIEPDEDPGHLSARLTRLGAEGWQLLFVTDRGTRAWFERPRR
jgi:hypothetical protein